MRLHTVITTILVCQASLFSQNLELIGKKQPVKINGGISVNQVAYATSDSISYRDPYSFFASGNLNISIYEWGIPFSFTYSNQNHKFQQPFNQYYLHPKYKWISGHIGYTSMSFSPYTVSGHLFAGVGADLTPPGKVKASVMFGRLKKKVAHDTTNKKNSVPTFERWGYGIKTGVDLFSKENYSGNMEFILFHAWDKKENNSFIPDTIASPKENLVFSTIGNFKLFKRVTFRGEYASSAITNNLYSDIKPDGTKQIMSKLGNYFHTNNTSEYFNGYKFNLAYGGGNYSLGLCYEHIDPGYKTFGGYYFNNDLANITLNGSIRLLEDKVSLSGNIGKQRDNLNNQKMSEFSRWVSSINTSFSPIKKLNFNLTYSNFQSYTNIRSQFVDINQLTPYDNLDTLDFTQLSQSMSFNSNYAISNDEKQRQNVNLSLNYQQASEKQGNKTIPGSRFFNINSAYNYSFIPLNLTLVTAINSNVNILDTNKTVTFGPTIAINKLFFDKKLRSSFSSSINKSSSNGVALNRIWNIRIMNSYSIKKKHNFNLSLILMNKKLNMNTSPRKLTEFTATLGYSFNF